MDSKWNMCAWNNLNDSKGIEKEHKMDLGKSVPGQKASAIFSHPHTSFL